MGKYLVFEGVSGTGKDTQARLLREYLGSRGTHFTIVPHPSLAAKAVLSAWRRGRHIDERSQAYILFADRHHATEQFIRPALARGEWVVSLRSCVSTLVYQGKDDQVRTWIRHHIPSVELTPDLLVYFDIDPAVALDRIRKRHEETGEELGYYETHERLSEMRHRYRDVLRTFRHVSIDATGPVQTTYDQLIDVISVLRTHPANSS